MGQKILYENYKACIKKEEKKLDALLDTHYDSGVTEDELKDLLIKTSDKNFVIKNFPEFEQNNTRIAVYGNTTISAADNAKLRVDIKAPSEETPSMTMAIEKYIKEMAKV